MRKVLRFMLRFLILLTGGRDTYAVEEGLCDYSGQGRNKRGDI